MCYATWKRLYPGRAWRQHPPAARALPAVAGGRRRVLEGFERSIDARSKIQVNFCLEASEAGSLTDVIAGGGAPVKAGRESTNPP